LAWRSIRQVRVDAQRVGLGDLSRGVAVQEDGYRDVLSLWLSRSPLTDLATASRPAPSFAWSASTLSLVATPPGRSLAFRAIARQPPDLAGAALAKAARDVPVALTGPRRLAESFASEVAAAQRLTGSSG